MFDLNKASKDMTKSQFIEEYEGYCPEIFGLKGVDAGICGNSDICNNNQCNECWEHAVKDIKFMEESSELFGKLRELTKEESKSYSEGLKGMSTPTGINIFDDYPTESNTAKSKTVTITQSEYGKLLEDSRKLNALEKGKVI